MQQKQGRIALVVLGIGFLASACDVVTSPTETTERPAAAVGAAFSLASETTWGGTGSDITEGAAVAPDGSSYLAGFTTSFGGGASKVFLVKFGASGSLVWQRTWDAPADAFPFVNDEARDVAVAPDGSVYVSGTTFVGGNGSLLLKFGADGSLLWQRTWGGTSSAESVAVAADGSVYVTGSTSSFGSGGGIDDLYVTRFSPDGALVWFKTWGRANGGEDGQGVAVAPDGNIYVAGVGPRRGGQFQFDAILLKITPDGTVIWQRAYAGGDVADSRGGVAAGPDGSAFIAGGFQGPGPGGSFINDALLLKVAADGSLVWDRRWGGPSGDFAEEVSVAPDGNVVFAGSTDSFGQGGGNDAFVLRLTSAGATTDAFTWGSAALDNGKGVGVALDGTISLGATTGSPPPYVFAAAPARTVRASMTTSTPALALVAASGVASDPGGIVETPPGSTTYAGGFDAALVRITP